MNARQFNYFDDWKNELLECPNCHWQGVFDQGSVEHYMEQMDCACPKCDVAKSPILAVVLYPTLPELRANMDKPGVPEWVERIDRGFDEFEAQKLREPSQLCDISESSFELVWDFDKSNPDDPRTSIKHGEIVVFSEPARYEEFKRFGEICEILKEKYGVRIKDLVPTLRSEDWLFGAASEAKNFVEWSRLHHFGASIGKQQQSHLAAKSLARDLSVLDSATQQNAQDQPQKQLTLNFDVKSARPVPGVPGASWERTENGTVLTLEPNAEFDALPKEVQSEMLDRVLNCFDKPSHIQRVTALRDAFANGLPDKAQQPPGGWPSAFDHFQYGPELPEIDAEEFRLVFDYSHDGSKYFVLDGEQIVLTGPAADDPDDHMTDNAPGEQFIEIAKRLKQRYGAKLVDLIPTQKAENTLTDLWGWACKLDRGRRLVQQRSTPSESGIAPGNVVVNASGVNSSGVAFTVESAPSITSVSPTSGAVAASSTITGSNFGSTQGSGSVKFNGTTATTIPGWSARSIVGVVPTGATTTVGGDHLESRNRSPVHRSSNAKRVLFILLGFALVLGAAIARQHQQTRSPAPPSPAQVRSAPSTAPVPTPSTYVFDPAKWAAANPGKDVNKAIAKAREQGYQVVQSHTYAEGFVPAATPAEALKPCPHEYDARFTPLNCTPTGPANKYADIGFVPDSPSTARETPPRLLTIVYDEWWASDYAAGAATGPSQCPPAMRQTCEDDARSEEAAFLGKFSGAFQSDAACDGMRLVAEHGVKDREIVNSKQEANALSEGYTREHLFLMVNFVPDRAKQQWTVMHFSATNPHGTPDRSAKGENDAYSLAHAVCGIARNRGGAVVE
jgi:hypothetical protein